MPNAVGRSRAVDYREFCVGDSLGGARAPASHLEARVVPRSDVHATAGRVGGGTTLENSLAANARKSLAACSRAQRADAGGKGAHFRARVVANAELQAEAEFDSGPSADAGTTRW